MLFALLAAFPRPNAGALPQGGSPARPEARRVVVVITGADGRCHAARVLGAGEDVVAYQARGAMRQKRARPDDAPRRARVPEGEVLAGAELATGAVPPLTAAGTADAARPAPPTPPTPPTRATLGIAPPVNPGCPTRLLVTGEPVAAVVPPGVMAADPRLRPKACIRIARPPGMFCPLIHDGAITRAIAGHDGRRCKARVAPPLRAKMYRMCRRPLASFSKCTEGV